MNEEYINLAIKKAKTIKDEIPVCAVIVKDDKIIALETNKKEKKLDVTSHAEILAIKKASQKLKDWRLQNCSMYVTLEPCPMCAWAILNSRISEVYFGSYDYNYGAFGSKLNLANVINSKIKIYGGIKEKECDEILKKYFKDLR